MSIILPVKPISQLFPKPMIMGCEGVAAAMMLQYNHHEVSASQIMKNWPTHPDNPERGFAGPHLMINPKVHQTIFPSAFVPYLKTYDEHVVDGTGLSLKELETIIDHKQPVLIYHTHLGFKPFTRHFQTSDGEREWVSNIHITLLVGYDDQYYYFIDPLWMQFKHIPFLAVTSSNRQIMRMSKDKMDRSYEAPGRLNIYVKPEKQVSHA